MAQYIPKGKNKWIFDVRYVDFYGNKQRKRQGSYRTKKEAKEAEEQFLASTKLTLAKGITFKEICTEYLLYKKNRIRETSYVKVERHLKHHILPTLGDLELETINIKHLAHWQDTMLSKGLSKKYINKVTTELSSIFKYAQKMKPNLVNQVSLLDRFKDDQVKDINYFTYDEYLKFESVIDDLKWKCFFNTLYFSGLRKTEALALNWNDVDFKNSSISVTKNVVQKLKGQGPVITPPKNKTSNRTIKLPNITMHMLKELLAEQKKIIGFNKNMYVFYADRPYPESTITEKKNKYCDEACVKRIRIHDFRHSHASLLINQSVNVLVVSKRLGHSDVKMTLNTYSHMFDDKEDEAVELLNSL